MNIWTKILLFFPLWLLFSGIFYGIIFIIYPESFSGSKNEFETLISTNIVFLLVSQVAAFLGTFTTIFFTYKLVFKQKPVFLKSILNLRGITLGIAIGSIEILLILLVLVLTAEVRITFQGFNLSFLLYAIIFLLVALSEEALARGYIFSNLYFQTNRYLAFIISSILFCLMHAFNSSLSWIGVLNLVLVGIFFCQLYIKNMNLSIPVGFHFIWNLLQGPVFGFAVSGFKAASIIKISSCSGSGFSFEGFGLEGSVITTVVMVIFIAYYYFTDTRNILKNNRVESQTSDQIL